jgi:hypothetical protein
MHRYSFVPEFLFLKNNQEQFGTILLYAQKPPHGKSRQPRISPEIFETFGKGPFRNVQRKYQLMEIT